MKDMANAKIELNREGVRALLKSPEMMDICSELAEEVASRAGDGYETSTYVGKNRVNASVKAETFRAMHDNLKNNTLLKALRSG